MFLRQKLTEQCSQPMEDVAKLRVHAQYPAGFAVVCFLISGQGDVARRARLTPLIHALCSAPDGALQASTLLYSREQVRSRLTLQASQIKIC